MRRARVAIDRLPSGRFRARLMIAGQRYTVTLPTDAAARLWEVETHAAVAERRGAATVTFGAYAASWLAGFIDDAPDRTRFETALERRLMPMLGQLPLVEVLEADRNELYGQVMGGHGGGDGGTTRVCLHLMVVDAVEDLGVGVTACCRGYGPASEASSRITRWVRDASQRS